MVLRSIVFNRPSQIRLVRTTMKSITSEECYRESSVIDRQPIDKGIVGIRRCGLFWDITFTPVALYLYDDR